MNAESAIQITCSECNAVLKAKPEFAGKRAKCPKCGAAIAIPAPMPQQPTRALPPTMSVRAENHETLSTQQEPTKKAPPATQRQKEYAETLGIVFRPDITRAEISKLIDEAVMRRDDERFQRLDDLSRRESEAYEQVRQQVLAEIDDEDCRLSKAEPVQMLETLSDRGLAAILITMSWDDMPEFQNTHRGNASLSFSDDLTQEDAENLVTNCAVEIMKRKGMI